MGGKNLNIIYGCPHTYFHFLEQLHWSKQLTLSFLHIQYLHTKDIMQCFLVEFISPFYFQSSGNYISTKLTNTRSFLLEEGVTPNPSSLEAITEYVIKIYPYLKGVGP